MRRSLTEYVRAARKWRRKFRKLAAVLQGKCTSVLVETEKNAHSHAEQRCFLRCNYFSVWSNWERATLVQEPYSVRRLTNLRFREFFCLYSIVALECFCGLPV